jgi:hypothetical protein
MFSNTKHMRFVPSRSRPHLAGALMAWAFAGVGALLVSPVSAQSERGLLLPSASLNNSGSHWGPRLGIVVTDTNSATRSTLTAANPAMGLKIQSAHILSDYNLGTGFRATLGLVRGATNLPWWVTPESSMRSGAGLTLQHMDVLSSEGMPSRLGSSIHRTVPYLGAGYNGHMGESTGIHAWRFQADLGLISLDAGNATKLGKVLSGNQGVDELIRELRLRPVVKFSINYKF